MSNKEEEIRTEDWLGIMWSVVCGFKWWIVLMNIGFIWFDPMPYDAGLLMLVVSLFLGFVTVHLIYKLFKI